MTTNNPPIAAWAPSTSLAKLASRHNSSPCVLTDGPAEFNDVALIRLSDYEILQAEREKLRKHLQNLIDQTTPLEPVPGNPMWSRRIQLDEVIAERDQLRAECEKLRKNLVLAGRWVPAPDPSCKCDDCVADAKLVAAIDAAMEGDKP